MKRPLLTQLQSQIILPTPPKEKCRVCWNYLKEDEDYICKSCFKKSKPLNDKL